MSFLQYYAELLPLWTMLSWLVGSVRTTTYTLWYVTSAMTVSSSATSPPPSAVPMANGTDPRSSVQSVSVQILSAKCQYQEPNLQIHSHLILFSYSQHGDLTATDATTTSPTTSAESTRGTVQEVIEVNRRVTAISNQIIPSFRPAFHLNLLIFDIRRPFTFSLFSPGSVYPHYDQRGQCWTSQGL